MDNSNPLLDDEELALLMAPVRTRASGAIFRIFNAGSQLDSVPPNTDILECQSLESLLLLLLQDSDFDALILEKSYWTDDTLALLRPLLINQPQIKLFVEGIPAQETEQSAELMQWTECYFCKDSEVLSQCIDDWYQRLNADYHHWLDHIYFLASSSHCEQWRQSIPNLLAFNRNKLHQSIPFVLICSSRNNPSLIEELNLLSECASQPPIILVNQHSQSLAQTCFNYCSRIGLQVLASLDETQLSESLHNIILNYYRRCLNRKALLFRPKSIGGRHVTYLDNKNVTGLFNWPEKTVKDDTIFYIDRDQLREKFGSADMAGVDKLKHEFNLENQQLTYVFNGFPPSDATPDELFTLQFNAIEICWIPHTLQLLMDSRQLFGITQVLIPIELWLEVIADETYYLRWLRCQERMQHRQIKLGLIGVSPKLAPQLSTMGLSMIVQGS